MIDKKINGKGSDFELQERFKIQLYKSNHDVFKV